MEPWADIVFEQKIHLEWIEDSFSMLGRTIGFTRWYDRVPELSQAVRMMEKLPLYQQQAIAAVIVGAMPMHQVAQQASDHGIKRLGSEKVMGLMKSKGKRRWYDHDPLVHQAFNYLYLMTDQLRYETAIKMIIAMRALDELARQGYGPKQSVSMVKDVFNRHLQHLLETTEFYLNEAEQPRARIQITIRPADEEGASDEAPAPQRSMGAGGLIDVSAEGMRIMPMKKSESTA